MNIQSIILVIVIIITFIIAVYKIITNKSNHCWGCSGKCDACEYKKKKE